MSLEDHTEFTDDIYGIMNVIPRRPCKRRWRCSLGYPLTRSAEGSLVRLRGGVDAVDAARDRGDIEPPVGVDTE